MTALAAASILAKDIQRFIRMTRNHSRPAGTADRPPGRSGPENYFNRELNWLEFNFKVLSEALNQSNPLLERLKFLAIFHTNLDEFFMVRVAGLIRQHKLGVTSLPLDGLSPSEQLLRTRARALELLALADRLWQSELKHLLAGQGLRLINPKQLNAKARRVAGDYFQKEIYPILTPQAIDGAHCFPVISGDSLNFLVEIKGESEMPHYVRLKIPANLPRFIFIAPGRENTQSRVLGLGPRVPGSDIIPLESLIAEHLGDLFPGYQVTDLALFRVTRNTDLAIEEDEAADLLEAVRDLVDQRRFGEIVRLETSAGAPARLVDYLTSRLGLAPFQFYPVKDLMAPSDLMELTDLDLPALKYPPHQPRVPAACQGDSIFAAIGRGDIFLYHPYHSFTPVLDFIEQAACDPKVMAIKQTLYRVGEKSPIIQSLIEARRRNKQVTAVVELKARFDELRNITWAEALEEAGVNVVYGLIGMKIHAKLSLVIRREAGGVASYAHIGTGNYNPATARIYTDFGLFTADQEICGDIIDLFNVMTGLARRSSYRRLLVSPVTTRAAVIERIDREISRQRQHGDGFLAFKMNQLADQATIIALYRASQAGVTVKLQIRGVCCLRPGLAGLSENIEVTSVVGRFLEHARLYYFRNGGQSEVFIGSADLMPRNLDRRVEVLTPILNPALRELIVEDILKVHLADNQKAWRLRSDGFYDKLTPGPGRETVDSQDLMMKRDKDWNPERG